jgi:uncharacterized coiled-coil protein SlyX
MASASTETPIVSKTNWKAKYEEQVKTIQQLKEDLTTQKHICYQKGLTEGQDEIKELTEKLAEYQSTNIEELIAENKALKEKLSTVKEKKVKEKKEYSGTLQELMEAEGGDWTTKHLTKVQIVQGMTNPETVFTITIGGPSEPKDKKERKQLSETEQDTTCWARVWNNGLAGRCNRPQIEGCYCKQHGKQVADKGLTNGDVRITGEGSIPNNKALNKKLYAGSPLSNPEGLDLSVVGIKQ